MDRILRRLRRRLTWRSIVIGVACLGALSVAVLIGIVLFYILVVRIRGPKMALCANCGSKHARSSFPDGLIDRLLVRLNHYPYRCNVCQYRYYRFLKPRQAG